MQDVRSGLAADLLLLVDDDDDDDDLLKHDGIHWSFTVYILAAVLPGGGLAARRNSAIEEVDDREAHAGEVLHVEDADDDRKLDKDESLGPRGADARPGPLEDHDVHIVVAGQQVLGSREGVEGAARRGAGGAPHGRKGGPCCRTTGCGFFFSSLVHPGPGSHRRSHLARKSLVMLKTLHLLKRLLKDKQRREQMLLRRLPTAD
jgi:hypothetical protein